MAYRILLVDDDPFFLRVYGDLLRSRGYDVETATSGEVAVATYKKGRYQLIIIDMVLPGLSGVELIEHILGVSASQDIVVVSGNEDVRAAVRAVQMGVVDYLVKPVDRDELLKVVGRLRERLTAPDATSRPLVENIEYAELQQLFGRGLQVLASLELESVCETLLATLSDVCGAQGAVLWLAERDGQGLSMHGYRGLVEMTGLPMRVAADEWELADVLAQGLPVLASATLSQPQHHAAPAPALWCPLVHEQTLVGVVALLQKLGDGFTREDAAAAKLLADCGALGVRHAQRYRQLERVGLRDPATAAYNMTYFVDYLGRELHKAQRYQRNFGVVEVSIDNAVSLSHSLAPEVYSEVVRRIIGALASVMHEVDVLARPSEAQMYVLLPETDLLGGLTFAQRARQAIVTNAYLASIDEHLPLAISFGPAAFPRDGDDIDQLFAACRRRIDEARHSPYRRLHLADVDFWSAVELLIGPDATYASSPLRLPRSLAASEDTAGVSRHGLFTDAFVEAVRSEVVAEAARQVRSGGWLFVAGRWRQSAAYLDRLLRGEHGNIRAYLLGDPLPTLAAAAAGVVPVQVSGEPLASHEVVLMLAEYAAYGFVGRRLGDGRLAGFHTADWNVVEGLMGKLQQAYQLQRGAA